MKEPRFYVYAIEYENGLVAYIGKGCGRRLHVQQKRFGLKGRKLKSFKREKDAYAYEREMIALHHPEMNRSPGGNGSRAKRAPQVDRWGAKVMKMGGPRVYAARALLNFGEEALSAYLTKDQIVDLKIVAEQRC